MWLTVEGILNDELDPEQGRERVNLRDPWRPHIHVSGAPPALLVTTPLKNDQGGNGEFLG